MSSDIPRKSLPYYPFYVNDFDDSSRVLDMNLSEVGLYVLALNEAWKRGSIPDDPRRVAMLIRRDPREVQKHWTAVRGCFQENGTPGRLVNERQETERRKALNLTSTERVRRFRERNGNVSETVSETEIGTVKETSMQRMDSVSSSGSYSRSEKEKKDESLKIEFEQGFWPAAWRKTAKKYAFECYVRQRKAATSEVIMAGVQRDSPLYLSRDPEHRPHMSTWLNEQRYNDEPDPVGVPPKSRIERLFDQIPND